MSAAKISPVCLKPWPSKAADGIRTRDLVLTKDALYQLSYSSRGTGRHAFNAIPLSLISHPELILSLRRFLPLSQKFRKRVKGIEPSSSAWKAVALPLSYTRVGTHHSSPAEPVFLNSTVVKKSVRVWRYQGANGGCRIRTCEGNAIRFTV